MTLYSISDPSLSWLRSDTPLTLQFELIKLIEDDYYHLLSIIMSDAILIIPIVMFANRVIINTLIWQLLPKIMIIVSSSLHTYDDTSKTQSSETLKQLKHLMMCDYPLIKLLDKSGE